MTRLTQNDLCLLEEALDAWVEKDTAQQMVGDLLGHVLAGRNPVAQAALERERERTKSQADADRRSRKEIATLLKARLIQMRHDLDAQERASSAECAAEPTPR